MKKLVSFGARGAGVALFENNYQRTIDSLSEKARGFNHAKSPCTPGSLCAFAPLKWFSRENGGHLMEHRVPLCISSFLNSVNWRLTYAKQCSSLNHTYSDFTHEHDVSVLTVPPALQSPQPPTYHSHQSLCSKIQRKSSTTLALLLA